MTLAQTLVGYVAMVTMVIILAGVYRRRLYRVCYSFPAYVAAVLTGDVLVTFWEDEFYNWDFWMLKETTYTVLLFVLALELTRLVFQAFPGALATARRVLLVALVLILLAVLSITPGLENPPVAQPRVMNGTALLFAALWALILWYHLPIHPFHLAIVQGLVPYLLVSTVLLRLLAMWGIENSVWMGLVDSTAYVLMLFYWAWAVWRPVDPPPAGPSLIRRVQPWRDKL